MSAVPLIAGTTGTAAGPTRSSPAPRGAEQPARFPIDARLDPPAARPPIPPAARPTRPPSRTPASRTRAGTAEGAPGGVTIAADTAAGGGHDSW